MSPYQHRYKDDGNVVTVGAHKKSLYLSNSPPYDRNPWDFLLLLLPLSLGLGASNICLSFITVSLFTGQESTLPDANRFTLGVTNAFSAEPVYAASLFR